MIVRFEDGAPSPPDVLIRDKDGKLLGWIPGRTGELVTASLVLQTALDVALDLEHGSEVLGWGRFVNGITAAGYRLEERTARG